jgi:3D (Asp-Asp-Asp) domain-containing protein
LPKRKRGAPWRAQNRTIPVARRAVMSLPLVAFILLAGPANGSAGRRIADHTRSTKAASTTRTTVASAGAHNQSISMGHKSPSPQTQLAAATANRSRRTSGKSALVPGSILGHAAVAKTTTASRRRSAARPATVAHKTGHQLIATKSLPATATTARHTPSPQPAPTQPARVPLGTFMVTCYDLYGHTADGDVAGPESVAVDPNVIRLGTTIYVPGIGERTADDTGGLIIGNHIDIWEPTYGLCADWGVRHLTIYRVG